MPYLADAKSPHDRCKNAPFHCGQNAQEQMQECPVSKWQNAQEQMQENHKAQEFILQ